MPGLPTGTVTFLFTDIEGSTRLLQSLGDRYAEVLAAQRQLLREACQARGGQKVDTQGDAVFVAFPRARDALAAAVAAQQAIAAHPWPEGISVRVRMGLHTGEPLTASEGYVGMDVHRAARICAAGHGGQILLSDVTRKLVEEDLPEGVNLHDLGEHRLKDLTRPQHLFQVVAAGLAVDFPPLKSWEAMPNNLPRQLTSFVGRLRETEEVKLLLSTSYLLTLTGSGGVGKTRLAVQVGAEVLDGFKDGVWLVQLAPLSDSALVPQTVASVLSVSEQPGRRVLATLVDYLRRKELLLLLDNCEHLIAPCAELAETLLRACQHLRILATSREMLGVSGEMTWPVPALSLPDPRHLPPPETLAQYEAVGLFVERAGGALPGFALTAQNGPAIAEICHRLDGIPLAIELAAARIRVLSVAQIAARLADSFGLLTKGVRAALPHHQTLRTAMDWSYNLLSQKERTVFRRLSVFAGGWTLEAAEVVCADEGVESGEVLNLLSELVDKSLAVAEELRGEARHRLLETVRQYAQSKLEEAGETEPVRTRHRDWYLGLAEQAGTAFQGPGQGLWLDRLEREHDNLRAALTWSQRNEEAETGLLLAVLLWWFWFVRGYYSEGYDYLESMLALSQSGAAAILPAARARALFGAGSLAWRRGHHARSVTLLEEGLALFREVGDKRGIADSLASLSLALLFRGDYGQAAGLGKEILEITRELGDTRGIANALTIMGLAVAFQGNHDQAIALHTESLARFQEAGDLWGVSWSLFNLGDAARHQGDHARATPLLEKSLELFRQLGEKGGIGHALNGMAILARQQTDYERATVLHRESLEIRKGLGDAHGVAESLEGLAAVAALQGKARLAAGLFGAAEALREGIGAPLPPDERPDYDRSLATLREALEGELFAAAWADGKAMTLEQAIERAMAEGPQTSDVYATRAESSRFS